MRKGGTVMKATDWKMTEAFRLILALALSVFLTLPLMAGEEYQEKFEKTVALSPEGQVIVSNISGDIKIMVWKEDKVKIEAVKYSKASSREKAKENAARVEIQVTSEPGLVRIETKYPESRKFWGGNSLDVSVDYSLWIPEKASIQAKSVSGDVKIGNVGGEVRANSISGDIILSGGKKSVSCKSVSGDVRVENVEADCDLDSVSGDVQATQVKGSIEASSVSGSVKMVQIDGAKTITAKSVSGSIEYKGQLNPEGRYKFASHSGDVKLFLPENAAFELEAATFSGSVKTEFAIEVLGKVSGRELRGKVNKGGALITAKSFSGDVEITKGR